MKGSLLIKLPFYIILHRKGDSSTKINEGQIYHIKDSYYKKYNKYNLMINYDKNHHSRPVYLAIKIDKVYWFIPLSSKIEKYKKIISNKEMKYKICRSIMICTIENKEFVFLIQNAFPVLKKHVKCFHYINNKIVKVPYNIRKKVRNNFDYMLSLKRNGLNLFFTDIDSILKVILNDQNKKY